MQREPVACLCAPKVPVTKNSQNSPTGTTGPSLSGFYVPEIKTASTNILIHFYEIKHQLAKMQNAIYLISVAIV